MQLPRDATEHILILSNLGDRLPIFTKGYQQKAVEGGIILSRTYHDANHLVKIADHIFQMLKVNKI